jgi:hypothetical protein
MEVEVVPMVQLNSSRVLQQQMAQQQRELGMLTWQMQLLVMRREPAVTARYAT